MLNAFTDCALPTLTGAETKVWLILFRDTKAATGTARTGQTDIARRAGLSARSVKLAVGTLAENGADSSRTPRPVERRTFRLPEFIRPVQMGQPNAPYMGQKPACN